MHACDRLPNGHADFTVRRTNELGELVYAYLTGLVRTRRSIASVDPAFPTSVHVLSGSGPLKVLFDDSLDVVMAATAARAGARGA